MARPVGCTNSTNPETIRRRDAQHEYYVNFKKRGLHKPRKTKCSCKRTAPFCEYCRKNRAEWERNNYTTEKRREKARKERDRSKRKPVESASFYNRAASRQNRIWRLEDTLQRLRKLMA